eukprot:g4040.t1
MGHWMLSKALALRHETLAQLQGGDADELQSNASYTGSNVTQCPEAWAEVQGWQDNDVRLLIPYLDAKVSHPLSIEAEPIAVEPVTMEPITFEARLVWAGRVAKELERIQQTKLLRACVLEWWRELSLKGDFAEKGLTRSPSGEISRLRSQALEAELAAALEDTQEGIPTIGSHAAHDSFVESIPPSRWDPRQADLQIRQLSHWAFDGLFFLMRSVFVTWRDQQKTQKHLVQAFSSSSTFLVTSLTTLCCRALFAVWLQATLASKGRLQYMQTRHLRPGILRRANRRTQGALRLLERLWLLRFAFSLWSTVAIAPSATGLQAPHRGASAP